MRIILSQCDFLVIAVILNKYTKLALLEKASLVLAFSLFFVNNSSHYLHFSALFRALTFLMYEKTIIIKANTQAANTAFRMSI